MKRIIPPDVEYTMYVWQLEDKTWKGFCTGCWKTSIFQEPLFPYVKCENGCLVTNIIKMIYEVDHYTAKQGAIDPKRVTKVLTHSPPYTGDRQAPHFRADLLMRSDDGKKFFRREGTCSLVVNAKSKKHCVVEIDIYKTLIDFSGPKFKAISWQSKGSRKFIHPQNKVYEILSKDGSANYLDLIGEYPFDKYIKSYLPMLEKDLVGKTPPKQVIKAINRYGLTATSFADLIYKISYKPQLFAKPGIIKLLANDVANNRWDRFRLYLSFERYMSNYDILLNMLQSLHPSYYLSALLDSFEYGPYTHLLVNLYEKSLVNMFKDSPESNWVFNDTMEYVKSYLSKRNRNMSLKAVAELIKQERIRPDFRWLHDTFVQIENNETEARNYREFKYTNYEKALEGVFNGYQWRLPLDSKELSLWGKLMHNCVGSYADRVVEHYCSILGVFDKQNNMKVCVEISNRDFFEPNIIQRTVERTVEMYINQYKAECNNQVNDESLIQSRKEFEETALVAASKLRFKDKYKPSELSKAC